MARPLIPLKKYKISIRETKTGEELYAFFQAYDKVTAQHFATTVFDTTRYEITSVEEQKSLCSIPIELYCPN